MTGDAVWDILVEECGARDDMRAEFLNHWPPCREFRFQGDLGFGGKVHNDCCRVYVTCYPEDVTPLRAYCIAVANGRLLEALDRCV